MKPENWLKWLRGRCREIGWELGSLTGQDYGALAAVAACWELYFRSDEAGQRRALTAVRALVEAMQPTAVPFAKELIAFAGDWAHRDQVWPLVVGLPREAAPMSESDELRELMDVLVENRAADYINSWSIHRVNGHCSIRAEGADLSTLEGQGATWDAAKNAFADALLEYLERLQPIGRG
jgi:hypothetical protein